MPHRRFAGFARRAGTALCFLLVLLAGRATAAGAQGPAAPLSREAATPGSELTIFHVVMGHGDEVWAKFEHNALWVHDPVRGTDYVYNYGAFDFNQPGYWGRFIRGDWLYWLEVSDIYRTLFVYREYANRSVMVQELNLSPAQRADLRDFLEWNAREENRYYYYDYYRDNCSTRIRDAIDRALGGQLRAATADSLTGTTYRWHSDRLVADDVAVLTGLRLGLGPGADREIDAWEEMFLPGKVQDQLRRARVRDEQGRLVPLVLEERVLYQAVGREPVRATPPGWTLGYLLAGLAIGGLFAGLAVWVPRSRAARLVFAGTTALWAMLVGLGGLILAFLWAFTNHVIAHANENLLQWNPLLLLLALLVPPLAFGVRWAARPALGLALAVAALSVLGLLVKVLPWFGQQNLSMIALVLPAHLGLLWATHRLTRPAPPAPAPTRRAGRRLARPKTPTRA
jgi:hypothetical protein